MSEGPTRFKIFIRLLHPFPEDKADKHPNLAKSPVRVNVREIDIRDDPRGWAESEYELMVQNMLKKGIRRSSDYFPLDQDLMDDIGFDVVIWDRREQESTGVVYESYNIDIPDKYIDS